MKHLCLRTLFFVLVFSLFLSSFSIASFANSLEKDEHKAQAIEFMKRISSSLPEYQAWEDASIKFKANLYSPESESVTALLYDVENKDTGFCGYLIMDYSSRLVLEFSAGISPYNEYLDLYKIKKFEKIKPEKVSLVYTPGTYAIKVKLIDQKDEKLYYFTEDPKVSINIKTPKPPAANKKSITPLGTDVHYKAISGVPDYAWTYGCIPTAIANVIGYWDSHGYSNLVTGLVISMIDEINNRLIAIAGNNATNSAIPGATQGYCRASGRYPSNFTVTNIWSPSYSQMQVEIDANRPCLVGFGSSGPYGATHMTAGVGYYYDDAFPSEKYVIVHDAWGSTPVDCQRLWSSSYNDFIAKIVP